MNNILQAGLHKQLESKKKVFQCHTNRISALDDRCLRRLFYRRTEWDKVEPTDDGLQGIFETGNKLEPVIERIISEVGEASDTPFRIVGQQMPTKDAMFDEHKISGTIDGVLQIVDTNTYTWETIGVIDVKTCNPNIYPQLNTLEDLQRYSWTRKYKGQLMMYALAHNLPKCFILLVNKTNLYDMKFIEFDLDFAYAEELLQTAKLVNVAVDNGTPPFKLNDPEECPRCQFAHICMPEFTCGGDVKISTDEQLEATLERLHELAPAKKENAKLERLRDAILVKGENTAVGPFLITWKESETHYAAKEARTEPSWRKTITKGG